MRPDCKEYIGFAVATLNLVIGVKLLGTGEIFVGAFNMFMSGALLSSTIWTWKVRNKWNMRQ